MHEIQRLEDKLKQRDFKLDALLEMTRAINANSSVSDLLADFERMMREKLLVEKLMLFTKEDQWNCLLKYGVPANTITQISDEQLFKNRSIAMTEDDTHESFDMVIPVNQNEAPIAYLLVGDLGEQEIRVSPIIKHMKFIQTLTNIVVVAIQNRKLQEESLRQERVKKELELAAEMQAILLPSKLPKNSTFEVGAVYKAHQQVGGDYYDFMELNDNEVMFCMADVSGKGVSAAFLMANFQAYLRSIFSYRSIDLVDIVRELNTRVMHSAMGEKYITLFLAVYTRSTRTLRYVNCGHNPPIIADKDGYTQLLKHGTIGLGMFDSLPKVLEGEVKLPPNSTVVCFTDGLVETENSENEEFGVERLEQLILSYYTDPISDLNEVIVQSLTEFKGDMPYMDDLAILSCRFY